MGRAMGIVPSADRTRRALAIAPVLAAVLVTGISMSRTDATPSRDPSPTAEARGTWLADCATCHGVGANGTDRGPSLAGVGRASVDFMVRTGRMPLASPGHREVRRPSPYSRAQQQALIAYVSTLIGSGGPGIPSIGTEGDVAAGGELYRLQCASCHSWGGNGGALIHREAPSVLPASRREIAEAVRTGPGTMPVFGRAAISDRQMDDLVAYTRKLSRPSDRGGWALSHLGPVSEGAVALVMGLGLLLAFTRWLGESR